MSEYVAAPHMLRFRCLAAECEDNCCKAWEIPISDGDLARLASHRVDTDALVRRVPDGHGGTVVVLKKRDDGTCVNLDGQGLCALHARHGEAATPTICQNYPRGVRRIGERLELTGRLSCPEVARLALLGDEPALSEAPPEPFEHIKVRNEIDSSEPYLAPFREVRDALTALCTMPGFSVASRLYFIVHLAERLGGFYHRGIETLDRVRLAAELHAITTPELQRELHQRRGASSPMEGLALEFAQGLMYSRLAADKAFERVVRVAANTHAAAAGVTEGTDLLAQLSAIPPMQMWRTHQERRARLGPARTARLDAYLARYCRSYWLQDWYSLSPTLMEHAMVLVVRVTLIRFLLVAHPDIRLDADDQAVDKAAIEVFYAVSRAYDHNAAIRDGLAKMLQKRGMLTVEHAAALLKL